MPTALSRLSTPPGSAWLTSALPLPNGPEVSPGLGLLTLDAPRSSTVDSTSVRLDHTFGPKLQLFSRYSHAPSSDALTNPGSLRGTRVWVGSDSFTAGLDGEIGRFGPNSLRLNWTAITEGSSTWTEAGGRRVDLSQYLPALSDPAQSVYNLQILTPSVSLVTDNAIGRQRQWTVVESVSKTRGRHTFAFGADYRTLAPRLASSPYMMTTVYADLAAFATNAPLVVAMSQRNNVSLGLRNVSAFAQDTWRISPRLAVNYGMRWEYNPAADGGEGAPLFESVTPGNPTQVRFGVRGGQLWKTGLGGFAPRFGIVKRLDACGTTILRASAGLFYDPGFASALEGAISHLTTNISLNGGATTYSQVSTTSPATASTLASNFRMPFSVEWSTRLERQLRTRSSASLSWLGSSGHRLLRLEQVQTADGDSVAFYSNNGASSYQAMQAQLNARPKPGFEVLAAFTWAHSIDNVSRDSDLFLWQPDWPGSIDRGNSSFDVRRSVSGAFTASPAAWRGWSLNGVFRARSGFPLTVTALNPRLVFGIESRPDLVGGRPVWIADGNAPGEKRLNAAAFAPSTLPRPGSLGRNAIQGFGMSQLDVALQREFRVYERVTAQFRVEAFNTFNHPNFGNPDTFLSNPTFGRATSMLNQFLGSGGPSTGLAPAFQIGGPRSLQIALRLRL